DVGVLLREGGQADLLEPEPVAVDGERAHRDVRGPRLREAVDPGGDRREGDGRDADGRGDLQRAAVGRGELLVRGLPLVLVAVVRADGMDDAGRVEAVRPGDLRVADLAPAEGAALLEQAGSGGGVDRA